jgi:hypothetical protein
VVCEYQVQFACIWSHACLQQLCCAFVYNLCRW